MDADPNDPDTRNSVVVGPHSRGARDSWHVTGGITRRAVVSGGLDAVVVTLEAHSANTRVQDQGCAALRIDIPAVDDVSRRFAAAFGGVETVAEAIEVQMADANVQGWACGALRNF